MMRGCRAVGADPYPLLAMYLLTGGRKSEVLGLEVDDVSFRLGKVFFRPNDHRRLKTRTSKGRIAFFSWDSKARCSATVPGGSRVPAERASRGTMLALSSVPAEAFFSGVLRTF
jgi:integrase